MPRRLGNKALLRDYKGIFHGLDLQEDDEQLAVEVHKVLVAEGALVPGVTSSAASSTSRVSPPRRGGPWKVEGMMV